MFLAVRQLRKLTSRVRVPWPFVLSLSCIMQGPGAGGRGSAAGRIYEDLAQQKLLHEHNVRVVDQADVHAFQKHVCVVVHHQRSVTIELEQLQACSTREN